MRRRPRMRPEFEITLAGGAGPAVLAHIREQLARGEVGLVGQVLTQHAIVQLPRDRRTLLSPYLNLEVAEADDATVLRGRFSPHPNVWTGFMATYGVIAMLGLVGLMYGLAELTLGEVSWTLWAAPAAAALIAFVYGASVIGQGLTAEDMYGMRAFVDAAVRAVDEAGAGTAGAVEPRDSLT